MTEKSVIMKTSDKRIMICLYLGFVIIMTALAMNLSVAYILDETGTIANASYLVGMDWTSFIKSTGSYYYKYGTAFLYFLPLKLIPSSFLAYKAMVIINGFLYAFVPVIAYYILRNYLGIEDKTSALLAAIAVGVVPSPMLFSTFARGDVGLITFSWIALFFLIKAETSESTRQKNLNSVLATMAVIYIFMCHSRGVVWLITLVALVVFMRLFYKVKVVNYIPAGITLAVGLVLDRVLKSYFKAGVYVTTNAKHNTVGTFNFEGLKRIATVGGVKSATLLTNGWMTSVIIGTVGLAFAGTIIAIIMTACSMTRTHKIETKEALINVYGFLTFVGSFALGLIFFFNASYGFVVMGKHKRADRFMYDRYSSVAYGIVVFIAMYYLIKNREEISVRLKAIILALEVLCVGFFGVFLAHRLDNVNYSARNAIGTGIFLDFGRHDLDNGKLPNLSIRLILAAIVGIIILGIVFAIRTWGDKVFKHKTRVIALLCIVVLSVNTGVNYYKLRLGTSVGRKQALCNVVEYMEELPDDFQNYPVYMSASAGYIKELQMALKDYRIIRNNVATEEEKENMFVLVNLNKIDSDELQNCGYMLDDLGGQGRFQIYAKGDKLWAELEKCGYSKPEM